jgi:DNA adenine methylase
VADRTIPLQSHIPRHLFDAWFSAIPEAKPFLRWAGGKQTFLARYGKLFPKNFRRYIEPFLGGGSAFLFVARQQSRPFQAILGDANADLIRTWRGVRDDAEGVYRRLENLQVEYAAAADKSELYYALRSTFNGSRPRIDPAVFIFINRLCWNGLYRVSREGKFNVPFGAPKSEIIVPPRTAFFGAAAALIQADIHAYSWENTLSLAEPGDFVFLDPPYISDLHAEDIKYSAREFSRLKHSRLAAAVRALSDRRIAFVLTNSGEPETQEMYQSLGLNVRKVSVPRVINSKAELRNPVTEILVTPEWLELGS